MAFRTPKWLEFTLAYCGVLAFEGDPVEWCACPHARICEVVGFCFGVCELCLPLASIFVYNAVVRVDHKAFASFWGETGSLPPGSAMRALVSTAHSTHERLRTGVLWIRLLFIFPMLPYCQHTS